MRHLLCGSLLLFAACSSMSGRSPAAATPNPDRAALLSRVDGFAQLAGVVGGGLDGRMVVVTNLNDAGPGSLREALQSAGPAWIVFAVSGDIALNASIRVASHKTVDGRGARIRIKNYGLVLDGIEDVILHNVTIADGIPATLAPGVKQSSDALQIIGRTRKVWVDHCSLSNFPDGLTDVTRASTDVTISWSHFSRHNKVMLLGATPDETADRDMRVSVHHNWFEGTTQRHPRVRFGRVHVYNNYYDRVTSYAVAASQESQVLSQGNIFDAVRGDMPTIDDHAGDDPQKGSVRSEGDLIVHGGPPHITHPELVFDAKALGLKFDLEKADAGLRDRLRAQTGAN